MNVLKQFDTVKTSEEGAWMHLVAPGTDDKVYLDDEQKQPVRIKLKGPDSPMWVNFQRKAIRSDKKDNRSVEDVAVEDSKLFAKMTLDFENIPNDDGKGTQTFSREAAIQLYLKYKDIRMQALRFVVSQENFTKMLPAD